MIKSNYAQKVTRLIVGNLALCGLVFFMACSQKKEEKKPVPTPTPPPILTDSQRTIAEYLERTNDFSLLVELLKKNNLFDALKDTTIKITLLAPNDGGMNAYVARKGYNTKVDFVNSVTAQLLSYHLIEGAVKSAAIKTGAIKSKSDQNIYAFVSQNGLIINGVALVIQKDIELKNGIIHVINEMIEPLQLKTMLQELKDRGNFKTLLGYLDQLGLSSLLDVPGGSYTLFAPNDAAFFRAQTYLNSLPSDKMREDVIKYHLLNEVKFTYDFKNVSVQTLNSRNKSVTLFDGFPSKVDALELRLDSTNFLTSSGVLHIITDILKPNVLVSDIIYYDDNYQGLYTALNRTGLILEMDRSNFVTLMAPSDTAGLSGLNRLGFTGLDDPNLDQNTLSNLLRYHLIIGRRVGSGSINREYYRMNNTDYIFMSKTNNVISIIDATRTQTIKVINSIPAFNGVVHQINSMMTPPLKTTYELIGEAVRDGKPFAVIDSIINASAEIPNTEFNLKNYLNDPANIHTMFLPTDESFKAFFKLFSRGLRSSLTSVDSAIISARNAAPNTKTALDTLIRIVRTMIYPGTSILVEDLPDGFNKVRTLQGYEVTINNRVVQGVRLLDVQGELVGPSSRRSGGRLEYDAIPLGTNWQSTNGMLLLMQKTAIPVSPHPIPR